MRNWNTIDLLSRLTPSQFLFYFEHLPSAELPLFFKVLSEKNAEGFLSVLHVLSADCVLEISTFYPDPAFIFHHFIQNGGKPEPLIPLMLQLDNPIPLLQALMTQLDQLPLCFAHSTPRHQMLLLRCLPASIQLTALEGATPSEIGVWTTYFFAEERRSDERIVWIESLKKLPPHTWPQWLEKLPNASLPFWIPYLHLLPEKYVSLLFQNAPSCRAEADTILSQSINWNPPSNWDTFSPGFVCSFIEHPVWGPSILSRLSTLSPQALGAAFLGLSNPSNRFQLMQMLRYHHLDHLCAALPFIEEDEREFLWETLRPACEEAYRSLRLNQQNQIPFEDEARHFLGPLFQTLAALTSNRQLQLFGQLVHDLLTHSP